MRMKKQGSDCTCIISLLKKPLVCLCVLYLCVYIYVYMFMCIMYVCLYICIYIFKNVLLDDTLKQELILGKPTVVTNININMFFITHVTKSFDD